MRASSTAEDDCARDAGAAAGDGLAGSAAGDESCTGGPCMGVPAAGRRCNTRIRSCRQSQSGITIAESRADSRAESRDKSRAGPRAEPYAGSYAESFAAAATPSPPLPARAASDSAAKTWATLSQGLAGRAARQTPWGPGGEAEFPDKAVRAGLLRLSPTIRGLKDIKSPKAQLPPRPPARPPARPSSPPARPHTRPHTRPPALSRRMSELTTTRPFKI